MRSHDAAVSSLTPPSMPKVLLVYRRSLYDLYVQEYGDPRISALVEGDHPSVAALQRAHARQRTALDAIIVAFTRQPIQFETRYRGDLSAGSVEGWDLIVVGGGDGTLLDASHHAGECPVLGINSDPERSVGSLCCATFKDADAVAQAYVDGALVVRERARLEVRLDGEVIGPPVLNDVLFSHTSPAATTRYTIGIQGSSEDHVCSGLWVSTATGATAAIGSAGGESMEAGDGRLQYLVREPYGPNGAHFDLLRGFVESGEVLRITSRVRTAALYFDGPHVAFPVAFGQQFECTPGATPMRHVEWPEGSVDGL